MAQQISSQLNEALTRSIALVESFAEKELNTVPFVGSWTPAQVADHILKSANGMDKLLLEPGKPAGRPADEKAEEFKNLFLDFSIKMNRLILYCLTKGILQRRNLPRGLSPPGRLLAMQCQRPIWKTCLHWENSIRWMAAPNWNWYIF